MLSNSVNKDNNFLTNSIHFANPTEEASENRVLRAAIHQISNADFIDALFPRDSTVGFPAVCVKQNDPSSGGWQAIKADRSKNVWSVDDNNYINCSTFFPAGDELKARRANQAGCHFVMLDDIGTKVPLNRFDRFELSWLLETSPGNYQGGIRLDPPLDADDADELLNAIIDASLCDSGSTGASTRWARLPNGINGKTKHYDSEGRPFRCRLAKWEPQTSYSAQQIIAGLGLTVRPERHAHDGENSVNAFSSPITKAAHLDKLKALLGALDPDCGYQDWFRALAAVFHETSGSEDGFALVDSWSSRGEKYAGSKDLEAKWRSFSQDQSDPVTIGTLVKMARDSGADVSELLVPPEDVFEPCYTEVVQYSAATAVVARKNVHPLVKYSASDNLDLLQERLVEQKCLLGEIAVMGQATVIYAPPNTGKTLILFHLITDAIARKVVDPAMLFYFNMDDNSAGLLSKAKIAKEYGFTMIVDGVKDFETKDFKKIVVDLTESENANGTVIILDTLKKFVDTMHKGKSSEFAQMVRRFVLKGGTLIALGHTNKRPDMTGKAVFAGTSDIVDDFDCAFTVSTLLDEASSNEKTVEFSNIKNRGCVTETVAYRYSKERNIPYDALVLSVTEATDDDLTMTKRVAEVKKDEIFIAAFKEAIISGINTKMKLAEFVAKNISVSKRAAMAVLEKYTGSDPEMHLWNFELRNRGAQFFYLLPSSNLPGTMRT